MVELTVRLVVSLAIVVGLLILTARVASRKFRSPQGALVRVVHRQSLSRTSGVAVVEVGGRLLVLGTTEHQVNVLTELDPEAESAPVVDLHEVRTALAVGSDVDAFAPQLATALSESGTTTAAAAVAPAAPAEPPATRRTPGAHAARSPRPASATPTAGGPLAGSVLSVQTWRQALSAVRTRA